MKEGKTHVFAKELQHRKEDANGSSLSPFNVTNKKKKLSRTQIKLSRIGIERAWQRCRPFCLRWCGGSPVWCCWWVPGKSEPEALTYISVVHTVPHAAQLPAPLLFSSLNSFFDSFFFSSSKKFSRLQSQVMTSVDSFFFPRVTKQYKTSSWVLPVQKKKRQKSEPNKSGFVCVCVREWNRRARESTISQHVYKNRPRVVHALGQQDWLLWLFSSPTSFFSLSLSLFSSSFPLLIVVVSESETLLVYTHLSSCVCVCVYL